MSKYRVCVNRIETKYTEIIVEASSVKAAADLGIDTTRDHDSIQDWTRTGVAYELDEVEIVG